MPDGPTETRREQVQREFDQKESSSQTLRWVDEISRHQRVEPLAPPKPAPRLDNPFKVSPEAGVAQQPGWSQQRENSPGGWSIGVFQDKDKIGPPMPWPLPGGTALNAPLFLDVPQNIVKNPLSPDEIRRTVFENTDGRNLLLTGAITGGAVEAGTWALDHMSGQPAGGTPLTGWRAAWRGSQYSPSQRAIPGLEQQVNGLQSQVITWQGRVTTATAAVDAAMTQRTALAGTFAVPTTPLSPADLHFFQRRLDIIQNNDMFTRGNIMANAGTAQEVALRQRLFTHSEAINVAGVADQYNMAAAQRLQNQNALGNVEMARDRAVNSLNRAQEGSVTNLGDSALRGIGLGLGIAAVTVTADMAMDKAMGNNPEIKNLGSWGLQGIGMPALLLTRLSPMTKIAGSIGLVVASHYLDREVGPPRGVFSVFSKPSIPEIGLVTAAAVAPIPNPWVKGGLVAGGWLAGRAWNLLDDKFEITGKTQAKLSGEARGATALYMDKPTAEGFTEAAARTERFARENPDAAAQLVTDFQAQYGTVPVSELMRGRAALLEGIADAKFKAGVRTDGKSYDWQERVGAGQNYDLGGEATNYYRYAIDSLATGKLHAISQRGKVVNGHTIDDAYINHFDAATAAAQAKLNQIYGGHDNLNAVVADIESRVRSNRSEMSNFGDRLKERYDTITDKDPRYKAKIARDLALLNIAFAHNSDISYQRDHYEYARRHLAEARLLDGQAPDQAKLEAMLNK